MQGPAGRAGIQRGDIILEVGGTKTDTVGELRAAVTSHNVGESVTVKYERDGEKYEVEVTLDASPEN